MYYGLILLAFLAFHNCAFQVEYQCGDSKYNYSALGPVRKTLHPIF